MQRGKPAFGGVPPSDHPGKIVIRYCYAHTAYEVREALRSALLKHFKPNQQSKFNSNRYFEKWIDVKLVSNVPFKAHQNRTFFEFTAYVYLTKTEYVEKIVDLFDEQFLPTWQEHRIPWLLVYGMFKILNVVKVGKGDTLFSNAKTSYYELKRGATYIKLPALMQDIKQHIKVVTGHHGRGPCKHWGYIHFENEKDREDAADYLKDLVRRKILALPIIKSDRGPLNECWR